MGLITEYKNGETSTRSLGLDKFLSDWGSSVLEQVNETLLSDVLTIWMSWKSSQLLMGFTLIHYHLSISINPNTLNHLPTCKHRNRASYHPSNTRRIYHHLHGSACLVR